jgi:hypothetical protein
VDLGPLRADHLDLGGRMGLPELPDRGSQQRDRRGVDRADPDHADAAVLPVGGLAEPVERIEHGEQVREKVPAGVAHPRSVAAAFQHVDAEFPLQAAH